MEKTQTIEVLCWVSRKGKVISWKDMNPSQRVRTKEIIDYWDQRRASKNETEKLESK